MLSIYAEALDRLRVRLNMYLGLYKTFPVFIHDFANLLGPFSVA